MNKKNVPAGTPSLQEEAGLLKSTDTEQKLTCVFSPFSRLYVITLRLSEPFLLAVFVSVRSLTDSVLPPID